MLEAAVFEVLPYVSTTSDQHTGGNIGFIAESGGL
jgi:hypothetical protein